MSEPAVNLLYPYQRRWVNDKARRKIVDKGRQTGFSFATMLEVVDDCMEPIGGDWIVLSAGERQSKSMCRTMIKWVRAYDAALGCLVGGEKETPWEEREVWCPSIAEKVTTLEVTFRNGKRVQFLPANPDTVRGESANVVADEFAFHKDAKEIMRAIGPSTLRGGYRMIIISTPNGKRGLFYEIFTGDNKWSKHLVPLKLAIDEGLDVSYEEMCDLLNNDPDSIAQELDGAFLDSESQFISPELIAFAESDKAGPVLQFEGWAGHEDDRKGELVSDHPIRGDLFQSDLDKILAAIEALDGELFLGYDVARHRHLSSLWFNKRVSSDYLKADLQCLVINLHRVSFESQELVLKAALKKVRRGAIDQSGIGAQLAENMVRTFGEGKVEGITFSSEIKETIAWLVRNKMANATFKFSSAQVIRLAFKAIRKVVTGGQHDRFDAETTEEAGHADPFWSAALCLYAGDQAISKFAYRGVGTHTLTGFFKGLIGKNEKQDRPRTRADYAHKDRAHKRTGLF